MNDKEFKFRLTTELYNMLQLKASASNMNASDYVRNAISEQEVKVDNSKDITKLIGSINKVGNNINQIALNLNIANNRNALSEVDYANLLDKLTIIEYSMNTLLKRA